MIDDDDDDDDYEDDYNDDYNGDDNGIVVISGNGNDDDDDNCVAQVHAVNINILTCVHLKIPF